MKKSQLNISNILLFCLLISSIFPAINIGSYTMPVLYLLLPLSFFVFFLILLGRFSIPKVTKSVIMIFLLIIFEIFLSTLHGSVSSLNTFIFPTDSIQYIARLLIFITFLLIFYHGKISADKFIKYFLITLNIGMLIGILQWIPWPGREIFINLYPFRDGSEQLSQLSRHLSGIRVHGIAQHATANGGLAAFFFTFAFSIYRYYKKHNFLSVTLMILSILNIIASQARAGTLALLSSIILFYLFSIYIEKKSYKSTVYFVIVSIIIITSIILLYKNGNPFIIKMIHRWERLIEMRGGGRVDQIYYFLSLLNNPIDYIFGLSKQVVNQSFISYGVEVEPINIFVTYGSLGFILQYSLVLVLLFYFIRNIRSAIMDKASLALLVASFVGLFSYQVFSIGYYFFREIRVGLFPWILMGVSIGIFERQKSEGEKNCEKYKRNMHYYSSISNRK